MRQALPRKQEDQRKSTKTSQQTDPTESARHQQEIPTLANPSATSPEARGCHNTVISPEGRSPTSPNRSPTEPAEPEQHKRTQSPMTTHRPKPYRSEKPRCWLMSESAEQFRTYTHRTGVGQKGLTNKRKKERQRKNKRQQRKERKEGKQKKAHKATHTYASPEQNQQIV